MDYDTIFMDFYGTLVREDDAIIERIVGAIAADSPHNPTPGEVLRSWRFVECCAESFGPTFRTQRALEQESLMELLSVFDSQLCAEELSHELFEYWRAPEPFADSSGFLSRLSVPVCIVSNIDEEEIRSAIRHAGFDVEHIVTSECARSYKPRPEMFHMALERLGTAPERALHVGDSWGSDVRGAMGVGIDVAWLNREGRSRPDQNVPVAFDVRDLDELSSLLHWA